jgi:hypothetical protein
VLHTHSRRLDYHPHVHLIVPAGAVDQSGGLWRKKGGKYLFRSENLARVFRSKWFEAMASAGLKAQRTLPPNWVVDCQHVGRGDKALIYLGRYLYRGVLPEKDILADDQGSITFRYTENSGVVKTRTLSGAEFLWLLLQHVLPLGEAFSKSNGSGVYEISASCMATASDCSSFSSSCCWSGFPSRCNRWNALQCSAPTAKV